MLYEMLQDSMKRYEFNRIISTINGLFDGHTNFYFPDDYFSSYYNSYGGFFPYKVVYKENKIYSNAIDISCRSEPASSKLVLRRYKLI
jgi:hypothetical protein